MAIFKDIQFTITVTDEDGNEVHMMPISVDVEVEYYRGSYDQPSHSEETVIWKQPINLPDPIISAIESKAIEAAWKMYDE